MICPWQRWPGHSSASLSPERSVILPAQEIHHFQHSMTSTIDCSFRSWVEFDRNPLVAPWKQEKCRISAVVGANNCSFYIKCSSIEFYGWLECLREMCCLCIYAYCRQMMAVWGLECIFVRFSVSWISWVNSRNIWMEEIPSSHLEMLPSIWIYSLCVHVAPWWSVQESSKNMCLFRYMALTYRAWEACGPLVVCARII